MIETSIEIPNRALFKVAEVCDIAQVQPYVLRSWEVEFPKLGVARGAAAARMYRRADVERVLRIKHLLFVEGLTLAGVRRRIEGEASPVAADDIPLNELLGRNARERLASVKNGLQGILDLLSRHGTASAPALHLIASSRGARPTGAGSNGKRATMAHRKATRTKTPLNTQKPQRRKRH